MSAERVKHLRSMLLIHSYIYYHRNDSLVSDEQWQAWAEELKILQQIPCNISWYDVEFADWDGTTGMHLPRDEWVERKATQLLKYRDEHENK